MAQRTSFITAAMHSTSRSKNTYTSSLSWHRTMKALIDRYRPRNALGSLDDEQARKYTKSLLKASKEIKAGEDLSKRDSMATPLELF